jgi:hypothetical protein
MIPNAKPGIKRGTLIGEVKSRTEPVTLELLTQFIRGLSAELNEVLPKSSFDFTKLVKGFNRFLFCE